MKSSHICKVDMVAGKYLNPSTWKTHNLIMQCLLEVIDHIRSIIQYKNKNQICFNQLINQ